MKNEANKTFSIGNGTVHIHGTVNQEKIKDATTEFLKEVERRKRKAKKEKQAVYKDAQQHTANYRLVKTIKETQTT